MKKRTKKQRGLSGLPPNRVTVKKVEGEWQARVYIDGKLDEGQSYFTGGGRELDKADAYATAAVIRRRMGIAPDQLARKSDPDVLGQVGALALGTVGKAFIGLSVLGAVAYGAKVLWDKREANRQAQAFRQPGGTEASIRAEET